MDKNLHSLKRREVSERREHVTINDTEVEVHARDSQQVYINRSMGL